MSRAARRDKIVELLDRALNGIEVAIREGSDKSHGRIRSLVWYPYRDVEHAILLIKLELGDESSASRLSSREGQAILSLLDRALKELVTTLTLVKEGSLKEALNHARECRDCLKSVLLRFRG